MPCQLSRQACYTSLAVFALLFHCILFPHLPWNVYGQKAKFNIVRQSGTVSCFVACLVSWVYVAERCCYLLKKIILQTSDLVRSPFACIIVKQGLHAFQRMCSRCQAELEIWHLPEVHMAYHYKAVKLNAKIALTKGVKSLGLLNNTWVLLAFRHRLVCTRCNGLLLLFFPIFGKGGAKDVLSAYDAKPEEQIDMSQL